ncbi:MAG TPA: hypothetical protein VLH75_19880 [Longimicrobiales bacterium]|nr:hypothetical protein [Longimicrobiales bacterium]
MTTVPSFSRRSWLMPFVALLAACGVRAPATVHPSWEPTFGVYAFEGSHSGRAPVTVSGTLSLGSEGFYLSSNHGSCRERLGRMWVAPNVGVACPGIRVGFRLAEGNVPEDGTARVTVQQIQERQVCKVNADGTQSCITVEEQVEVPVDVRIQVRRSGQPGA